MICRIVVLPASLGHRSEDSNGLEICQKKDKVIVMATIIRDELPK